MVRNGCQRGLPCLRRVRFQNLENRSVAPISMVITLFLTVGTIRPVTTLAKRSRIGCQYRSRPSLMKFTKITKEELERRFLRATIRTAYEVFDEGKSIGYVWSKEGFSYRGTQGWNSGIRIRDYSPIEWYYGRLLGTGNTCYSRQRGAERLLELR